MGWAVSFRSRVGAASADLSGGGGGGGGPGSAIVQRLIRPEVSVELDGNTISRWAPHGSPEFSPGLWVVPAVAAVALVGLGMWIAS